MNFALLFVIFSLALPCAASAQASTPADPPDLHAKRQEFLQALERASVPVRASYMRTLESLKSQYMRAGKLDETIAIDNEMKRVAAMAQAVAVQNSRAKTFPITIISASYGDPPTNRVTDVTRVVRQAYLSGEPTVKLDERKGRTGKDPAEGAKKVTSIHYSIDGQVKNKTFGEGHTLDFERDLK